VGTNKPLHVVEKQFKHTENSLPKMVGCFFMCAAEGWQFIALGSELRMLVSRAQEYVKELGLSRGSKELARY